MLLSESLTEQLIGLAIEVHRHAVPGLLLNFNASRLMDGLRRDVV